MAWYNMVRCGTVRMIWCGMVWCNMVWCGMVQCGVVWYGMVWYGMVWYGMVWYGMVWYGMVRYGRNSMIWCSMVGYGTVQYDMVRYYMNGGKWCVSRTGQHKRRRRPSAEPHGIGGTVLLRYDNGPVVFHTLPLLPTVRFMFRHCHGIVTVQLLFLILKCMKGVMF